MLTKQRRNWKVTRAWVAGGAVLALAAGLLGGMTPAQAHPGIPLAVFDPTETGWASLRDMTDAQFDSAIAQYKSGGFIALDIEADTTAAGTRRGVVFQRNTDGRDWIVEKEMTAAQYSAAFDTYAGRGYRLVDFETYVKANTRYVAGLWVNNNEGLGWSHLWGLTYAQAVDYYEEQRQRRLPVDVDAYTTGSGIRYALIWADNPTNLAWRLHLDLSSDQFSTNFDTYASQGFRMLMVDSVRSTNQRYLGIWYHNSNGNGWLEQRDMTEHEYANNWHRNVDRGYRVITYERYETASGWRYTATWRRNGNRPLWPLREQVDARIQQEIDNFDVPGMSVAVIHNGQFVYKRGFGHADVANDVWLHSGHVLRLASVSKAVAGVFTMLMDEQGVADVTDDVADHIPGLPAHHTQTIEQLVSNRGCVRHYNGSATDATLASTEYNNLATPTALFWNDPLVCTVGQSSYSTFGYNLPCLAFEEATGVPFHQLFVNELTAPFKLGTLRPEDIDDTSVNRSKLYNTNNSEATPDEISWKVCGGGLESSVSDLADFGRKVLDGDIVTPASVEHMWTGTPWTYAYGWSESSEDGHQFVHKNGGQLGANSYIRMYPDDDIIIAVLSNRYLGGHSAVSVGQDIGAMIVATLP
ncbi:serine hydrolase [Allorhizocola rhizosphaerae]|uniref:serine hydrolase n=1 Tax=Allorhizocola rhizosphaerae TaxID=1872709 RepID=UPI0013C36E7C|nr:serine hydrolase [Allorhizocola rhizosphaerae]